MTDHMFFRQRLVKALQEELVGPSPQGLEIGCSPIPRFDQIEDSYGPWRQKGNGEEILQRDSPTRRYGIGVLHPWSTRVEEDVIEASDAGDVAIGLHSRDETGEITADSALTEEATKDIEERLDRDDEGSDDLDLSGTNSYRPSSMGISFLAHIPDGARLVFVSKPGRYERTEVQIGSHKVAWWLRVPMSIQQEFDCDIFRTQRTVKSKIGAESDCGPIDLRVELYSRPNPQNPKDNQEHLITVCLVNRTEFSGLTHDEQCAFQTSFEVKVVSPDGAYCILPYPEATDRTLDSEERSLALLYRDFRTYAVGHGCAADWGRKDLKGRVCSVQANCLPVFETPSITPDISDRDDHPIQVSMANLAGMNPGKDGFDELENVITSYKEWIYQESLAIDNLPVSVRETAERHLNRCARCADRMCDGMVYLKESPLALRAFQLANYAILLQQLVRKEPRPASYNKKTNRWDFSDPYVEPDHHQSKPGVGQWRAFQIAFLLMSLRSSAEHDDPDRETVELIWFPTGGGKTEAYLGLAAFSLFMRRLKNPQDVGVHVITRYTLRLLTTQQFQRASRLICAMEYIRRLSADLGEEPFSIGIWVGSSNTPNTRKDAISVLQKLQSGDKTAANKFILSQCPWCGAQMGPIRRKEQQKWKTEVIGYARRGDTVIYRCPDAQCQFRQELPIYAIDEDIYDRRPSLVIGTVDKFAMLTWRPEARSMFGINREGVRENSPPGLIIQDELHLISGPLGSMVGLYEAVIEELCTDYRNTMPARPKIVSSTATIRRYAEQVKALYGRHRVELFPSPGINADDSFFAKYARDKDGGLQPGRLYVGVHGPALGSLQTVQVRTFTALMQAATDIPSPRFRDPWWTLLMFFNSLRELGTTLSLFQSDIPDYLKVTAQRLGIPYGRMRKLWRIRELTGRLGSDEVPQALADLEVTCENPTQIYPVDACLASNILEVGVDIERLSLMAVVGQPKSTSQYIQVTGRIGRRWWEKPGLVVTIYTASKPRDRSHFERFRSYHEQLYAQVEPVSVTPFSPPALDRALHAVMVLYARQLGKESVAKSPYPYPSDLIEALRVLLRNRIQSVDPDEVPNFERVLDQRAMQWKTWERTAWERRSKDDSYLLRIAGEYVDVDNEPLSWPTPSSMRTVDAECQAQITSLCLQDANK
ncbi:MAG: helicase [Anaerolineae bacterium]|nr:helicase [Anaerolineae bacterium]